MAPAACPCGDLNSSLNRLPWDEDPAGSAAMADPSTSGIRKRALLNRVVLNLETAEELGVVTEVLVDIRNHRVQALLCSNGMFGRGEQRFPLAQIASVGRDGVVVKLDQPPIGESAQQQQPDIFPLGNLELWSDNGDRIGQLVDFRFDSKTGEIRQYLFVAGETSGMPPGLYGFAPEAVISTSRRRMMAHDNDIRQATLLDPNVQAPPASTLPRMPFERGVPDPRRGWESAMEETRDLREKFGGQVQERGQKFKQEAENRFGNVFDTVKKRTRRLRNQLRETVTDVTAGLPSGRRLDDEDMTTIDVDPLETRPESNPSESDRWQ
jgi:uncharacterized protein YrrD